MFQRILVPLDGSPRAEKALPLAAQLARSSSATLFLLRIIPPPIYATTITTEPASMRMNSVKADLAEADNYLQRVVTAQHFNDIRVEKATLEGPPALTILQFARLHEVDLLLIKSHGQTGFLRWMLGSVAQQLVRHSPIPVLVLRDTNSPALVDLPGMTHPLRILVPLNGTAQAEAALLPAAQLCVGLAAPGQGTIHLTRTVQQFSTDDEEEQGFIEKINRDARIEA
jgi:nucleotide-binding universal stress UspA family protein